jgi:hypothetical protein
MRNSGVDSAERANRKYRRDVAVYFDQLVKTRPKAKKDALLMLVKNKYGVSVGFVYKWWYVFLKSGNELGNFKTGKTIPRVHGKAIKGMTTIFVRACIALHFSTDEIIRRLMERSLILHSRHGISGVLARKKLTAGEAAALQELYDYAAEPYNLDRRRDYPAGPKFSPAFAKAAVEIIEAQTDGLNGVEKPLTPERRLREFRWAMRLPSGAPPYGGDDAVPAA